MKNKFNILELVKKIEHSIPEMTEPDKKVLRVVQSF